MQKEQGWDSSILCCSCEKKLNKNQGPLAVLLSACVACACPGGEGLGDMVPGALDVLTAWVTVLASASWRQAVSLALVTRCWLEWVSLPQSRVRVRMVFRRMGDG